MVEFLSRHALLESRKQFFTVLAHFIGDCAAYGFLRGRIWDVRLAKLLRVYTDG